MTESNDAAILAAERELDRLRALLERVGDSEEAFAMVVEGMNLEAERILGTPPAGAAGAAAKLRLLTCEDMGIPCGKRNDGLDLVALGQVAALLESLAPVPQVSGADA
jgi:hypothetical protein